MTENKYGLDLAITDLWYIPFWKTKFFYVTIITSLILLLILLVYLFYQNRKLKAQDPLVLLLASLNSYKQKIDQIDAQTFYFDLIFKFKQFIGYKYNLVITDKTDCELSQILHKNALDERLVEIFADVLKNSYVVRFAKGAINKSKMESDLQKSIAIMQQIISSVKD